MSSIGQFISKYMHKPSQWPTWPWIFINNLKLTYENIVTLLQQLKSENNSINDSYHLKSFL